MAMSMARSEKSAGRAGCAGHGAEWATRATAAVTGAVRAWWREVKLRREAAHLSELDDRMLADIGISRSQIHDAVHCGRTILVRRSPLS